MNILAIDPSLTSTGYAYQTGGDAIQVGTIRAKNMNGVERLQFIKEEVNTLISLVKPEVVSYEGYAMSRFANRAFDLGELGGVLKLLVFGYRIPILLVPPTCLKLYATGKGNADKGQVMVAMAKVRRRLFSCDDEADAYALLQLGLAFSSSRLRVRDPRHHTNAAIRGCQLVSVRGN